MWWVFDIEADAVAALHVCNGEAVGDDRDAQTGELAPVQVTRRWDFMGRTPDSKWYFTAMTDDPPPGAVVVDDNPNPPPEIN